jgi:hypothetical protein
VVRHNTKFLNLDFFSPKKLISREKECNAQTHFELISKEKAFKHHCRHLLANRLYISQESKQSAKPWTH